MKKYIILISLFYFQVSIGQETSNNYDTLIKSAYKLYTEKHFQKSAETYSKAFKIQSKINSSDFYNAACSWALAGNKDSAFALLFRSKHMNIHHLNNDKDLKKLHKDLRWKDLINYLEENRSVYVAKNKCHFLDNGRIFYYDAILIDKHGDTITNEKFEIIPLGRPWLFQRIQQAYKIIYHPDTAGLRNFRFFDDYECMNEKRQNYYKKHHRVLLHTNALERLFTNEKSEVSEITGGIDDYYHFWLHPPRCNQYYYTQFAPYPLVYKSMLSDSNTFDYKGNLWIPGDGIIEYDYIINPKKDLMLNGEIIKTYWEIKATSNAPRYGKSFVTSYFTKEYGYLNFDYLFFDGTKINITLKNVENRLE